MCRESHGGVYFERGPLVYSLGMKGERSVYETKKNYPSYRMYADKKWNYAVIGNGESEFHEGKDEKWTLDADIPSITFSCREDENWKVRPVKKLKTINWKYEPIVKDFEETRTFIPSFQREGQRKFIGEEERVTLYPYGACKIRMAVLPKEEN